jgi:L-2,4-diaminobutyric acid acetyltransferase
MHLSSMDITQTEAVENDVQDIAAQSDIQIRSPDLEDAAAIADLVGRCPPLDLNSTYCYLLQCAQFAETCAVAEVDGVPVGYVSAHRLPQSPTTLFVWQVAVASEARGRGLARGMILNILGRPSAGDINEISATVTGDNGASMHMFCSLARRLATTARRAPYFDEHRHFAGRHPSELLINVGPFSSPF